MKGTQQSFFHMFLKKKLAKYKNIITNWPHVLRPDGNDSKIQCKLLKCKIVKTFLNVILTRFQASTFRLVEFS